MLTDLATLLPSAIVCAAFLAGVIVLVRREMAPRRRRRGESRQEHAEGARSEEREHTEL